MQPQQNIKHKTQKSKLLNTNKLNNNVRLLAVIFFAGALLIIIFGLKTLVTWWFISRIYAFLAVVLFFLPNSFLPKLYSIYAELKIILTIFGLAPLITGLVLAINFGITIQTNTECYKIEHWLYNNNEKYIEVFIENDIYNKQFEMHKIPTAVYPYNLPDSVCYTISKGIFRLKTYRDAKIIYKKTNR